MIRAMASSAQLSSARNLTKTLRASLPLGIIFVVDLLEHQIDARLDQILGVETAQQSAQVAVNHTLRSEPESS